MCCTRTRSVGGDLLAIGLVNIKKKSLVALASGLYGPRPSWLLPAHAYEKVTQVGSPARSAYRRGAAQQ
jgi:hypothetical protein